MSKPNKASKSIIDSDLQLTIQEKISQLKVFESDVDGIYIIHELKNFSIFYINKKELVSFGNLLGGTYEPVSLKQTSPFKLIDEYGSIESVLKKIKQTNNNQQISFFQQLSLCPKEGYSWYFCVSKISLRDKEMNPILALTISLPVDANSYLSLKAERIMKENNFIKQNFKVYSTLTKREKEILKLMALGNNSVQIAAQLHISETTATTHRRNIKSKLKANTSYEISQFALAFDLI